MRSWCSPKVCRVRWRMRGPVVAGPRMMAAGAVAEEDGGFAVGGVEDAGVEVGADDEGVAAFAGEGAFGGAEGEDFAGADGVDVECCGVCGAEVVLDVGGGGWLGAVGCGGGDDDGGEFGGGDAG